MSAPRTKRLFAGDASQRQITTFFPRTASSAAASDLAAVLSTTHLAAPPEPPAALPPAVQANLLSVGMRVRKSVPEGYKTGADTGVFALWSDSSRPAGNASGPAPQAYSHSYTPGFALPPSLLQPPITSIHPSASTAVVSSRRELLPFCGLHRVGGLAAQPDSASGGGGVVFADEVFFSATAPAPLSLPGLTLSQATAASVSPPSSQQQPYGPFAAAGRKRVFGAIDTEAGRGPPRDGDDDGDGDVSPRTVVAPLPFPGMADGDANAGGRAIAVPRRRSRKGFGAGGVGQENVVVVVDDGGGGGAPDDFDDAEFLVWGDGGRRQAVDFDMDDV